MVVRQADVFQWTSSLHAALFKSCEYFDTPIPAQVLSILSESKDRHQELVRAKSVPPTTRVVEEQQSFMERKWFGKLIVILGLIFPSPAYMHWRYQLKNSWTLPLWYIHRWWGIFVDGARTVWYLIQKAALHADPPTKSEY
jgi:hypothetical protein